MLSVMASTAKANGSKLLILFLWLDKASLYETLFHTNHMIGQNTEKVVHIRTSSTNST